MFLSRLNLLFALVAGQFWDEAWRPQFHQSTPVGWGNDPNGMVFDGTKYHLFYQHYPYDTIWGPMHWGHSTSEDLLTWEHHDVAIKPVGIRDMGPVYLEINGVQQQIPEEEWPNVGQAFSGSAYLDKENRFNMGANTIVLMWTEHTDIYKPERFRRERQSMGYLLEREGYSTVHYWDANAHGIQNEPESNMEYYDGDNRLPATTESDIRDPKFVKYDETTQLAIVANCDRMVIYSAPLGTTNQWVPQSAFGVNNGKLDVTMDLSTHDPECKNKGRTEGIWGGRQGGVWECPDLIKMPVEGTQEEFWVMIVSIGENQGLAVDDGPNTGSATMYFVGTLDKANKFQFIPAEDFNAYPKWIDYGPDSYAGVTYDNTSPPLFQAWMSNWLWANQVPTGAAGWRSGMTLPRQLRLVNLGTTQSPDYRVVHEFVDLSPLYDEIVTGEVFTIPNIESSQSIHTPGVEVSVTFSDIALESASNYTVRFSANPDVDYPQKEIEDFVEVGLYVDEQLNQEFRVTRASALEWTDDRTPPSEDFNKAVGHYNTASVSRAPRVQTKKDSLSIHVVYDTGSVEVLFDDGEVSMTSLSFPNVNLTRLSVRSTAGEGRGRYAALHSTVVEYTTTTPFPITTSPTTTTRPPTTTTTTTSAPTCPSVTCPAEATCPLAPTCRACEDSGANGLMKISSFALMSAAALYLIV